MARVCPCNISMRASIGSAGVDVTPCAAAPLRVVLERGGGRAAALHLSRRNALRRCVGELHDLGGSAHRSPCGLLGCVVSYERRLVRLLARRP